MSQNSSGEVDEAKKRELPYLSEAELRDLRSPEVSRLFRGAFRRLWFAQVTSSFGDWIGLIALTLIAARLGAGSQGGAIALILTTRLLPGLFLGPVIGIVLDRFNRKTVMVCSDIARAIVFVLLTQVDNLYGLVASSMIIELATLAWGSAKEAAVPGLVDKRLLTRANSLSIFASYGTAPFAAGIYAALAAVAKFNQEYLPTVDLVHHQQDLALLFDAVTYAVSAVLVLRLPIDGPQRVPDANGKRIDLSSIWSDMKEGVFFIRQTPTVRAVVLGMATGIFGGAMIVPLGNFFTSEVLNERGNAPYALLQTALGIGVAVGVVGLTFVQKRVRQEAIFVYSVFGAAAAIFTAASAWQLKQAALFIGVLGFCTGGVYVFGLTILQKETHDDIRGRTFASFFVLMRLCLIVSLIAAPALRNLFDQLSTNIFGDDQLLTVGGTVIRMAGVRLTLWFGSLIILLAGFISLITLTRHAKETVASNE